MLSALLRITYILLLVLGIAGLFWFAPPDTPTFAGVIMAVPARHAAHAPGRPCGSMTSCILIHRRGHG